MDDLYYSFLRKMDNIEEEDFDIDGIKNIFINTFDEKLRNPLDEIFEKNNIHYSYSMNIYIDYDEDNNTK